AEQTHYNSLKSYSKKILEHGLDGLAYRQADENGFILRSKMNPSLTDWSNNLPLKNWGAIITRLKHSKIR
ncbi:MAG: hypothetical protein WBC06_08335, partial [Chitinophagaceae bacterium]